MIEEIKLSNSKAYLISNDNSEYLLVDTGSLVDKDKIIDEIKNKKIVGIILTHNHGDCSANAKNISDMFKCKVYMSHDDYELFENQGMRMIYSNSILGKIKAKKIKNMADGMKIDIPNEIEFVVNGDNLKKIGFDEVKIIGLPGHTRGSIGILVGKKELIVGDTLVNENKPCENEIYEEKASLNNSLEIIKDILPSRIYPCKGESFNYCDYFKMEKITLNKKENNKNNKNGKIKF